MINKVEKLILDWLKSGNENTTYIAHQISKLFNEKECVHPLDELKFWNDGTVECKICKGKFYKF